MNFHKIVRILFLAANPLATSRLDLEEELRSLENELRSVRFRDQIDLIPAHAVRPDDLIRLLRQEAPTIVHFSGHGSKEGIILRGDLSDIKVPAASLARVFRDRGIKLVVLNACFSDHQAEALKGTIPVVVGTTASVDDEAARRFSMAFYRTIGDGYAVSEAFRDGCDVVDANTLEDVFRLHGDANLILCGWPAHDIGKQPSDLQVRPEPIDYGQQEHELEGFVTSTHAAVEALCAAAAEENDDIYVAPHIPPRILRNARSRFLKDEDLVIAFIDNSYGGKDGLAILTSGLCWRNSYREPSRRLTWAEARKFSVRADNTLDVVRLGRDFWIDVSGSKADVQSVARLIRKVIGAIAA
jgi:hypothetical protein